MKRLVRRQAQAKLAELSPLTSRLFTGRGIVDIREADHRLQGLLPPDGLKGLDAASDLLASAVKTDKRILVIGDFDADGATSCVLLVHGLKALGATHVDYLVPNRFEFGYGLTPEIVAVAARFQPDLLITVDNGISSIDGVAAAKRQGYQVLISDHHLPGAELPIADAIVNPNQLGCEFSSKHLAGVGVAFYLLSAVRQKLRAQSWFADSGVRDPNLADYLDLVALGTIADVVPLDHNNRILVNEGVRRIRGGRSRPGLLALIAVAGANRERLVSRDLAFGVAPRLNAAGRLEDISLGIECLLSTEDSRAMTLAGKLDELNRERRTIEADMKVQAIAELDKQGWITDRNALGLCLFHEEWHQGVVGIVASRIKDQTGKPVIAFARSGTDELKGSGRSVAGLHIRDALDAIAAQNPGLVLKFGGHAMAAGLSLHPANLNRFKAAFDTEVRRWLTAEDLEQVVISDGPLGAELDLDIAHEIMEAAPWGQGFAEPVFDGQFEIVEQRIVGGSHLKMTLRPVEGDRTIDAIAFNYPGLAEGRFRHIAYCVDINRYRGQESVQLIVETMDLSS
jgi:single-stranded-DNA-specific exonuclease